MGTRAGEWLNLKGRHCWRKTLAEAVTAEKIMHEFDPGSPAEGKGRIPRKKTAGGFCDAHLSELAMKLK